jgi:hypothetical protein
MARSEGREGWTKVLLCFSFDPETQYQYIEALLSLAKCAPMSVGTHKDQWAKVTTPLRAEAWKQGLATHPDRGFAEYICKGVREGFRIGYNYSSHRCKPARGNMKSATEQRSVLDKHIQKREKQGDSWGPSTGRSGRKCNGSYP